MKRRWQPEDLAYYHTQKKAGVTTKKIAESLGVTEWGLRNFLRRSEFGRDILKYHKCQTEDLFSVEDCSLVTGIRPDRIKELVKERKLRGNGLIERKDLANFICRYPAECTKGNIIQIIYILGGDKCSPNLK